MTRFGFDALTAIRLAEEGLAVAAAHSLVAPSLMRSEALGILHRSVRAGEREEQAALTTLRAIAGVPMRVLGDGISRQTAWIAADLDLDDPSRAEYLAATPLQADALVALDPWLAATDPVTTAAFAALLR